MMNNMTDAEKVSKMKEKFDELVAYYNENGELPSMESMHKKMMDGNMRDNKMS